MAIEQQASSGGHRALTMAERGSRGGKQANGPFSPSNATVNGKTKEGRFVAVYKRDLIEQLGGAPTTAQLRLVERAAMLALHLLKADQKAIKGEGLSEQATRAYLAMHNALTKTLAQLDGVSSKAKEKAEQKPEGLAGMAARYAQSKYPPGVPVEPDAPEGDE
jgi:hypothetical protein